MMTVAGSRGWDEAHHLAALDVYLRNNPTVIVPPSAYSLLASAPVTHLSRDRHYMRHVHLNALNLYNIGLDYSTCIRVLSANGNDPRAAMCSIFSERGFDRVTPEMSAHYRPVFNYLYPKCVPASHVYAAILKDSSCLPRSMPHARRTPDAPFWEIALYDELSSW